MSNSVIPKRSWRALSPESRVRLVMGTPKTLSPAPPKKRDDVNKPLEADNLINTISMEHVGEWLYACFFSRPTFFRERTSENGDVLMTRLTPLHVVSMGVEWVFHELVDERVLNEALDRYVGTSNVLARLRDMEHRCKNIHPDKLIVVINADEPVRNGTVRLSGMAATFNELYHELAPFVESLDVNLTLDNHGTYFDEDLIESYWNAYHMRENLYPS